MLLGCVCCFSVTLLFFQLDYGKLLLRVADAVSQNSCSLLQDLIHINRFFIRIKVESA